MTTGQTKTSLEGEGSEGAAREDGTAGRALRRTGLCLAGGGITGAMYEVGCLAALEDAFEDFRASEFEVYVGASSGAIVATALAGGLTAGRMYRALLDPADDFFALQRHHLLRLDSTELRRVWSSGLGAIRRLLGSVTSRPLELDVWNELDRFYDSLPAGLFSAGPLEDFVAAFLRRRGVPESFERMPRKLMLVANDLDGGERAVFGSGPLEHVPVSRAIAASCAVPMLYAPVRIGGRDFVAGGVGEAGHVDVAVEYGCERVIVFNAMVPIRIDPEARGVPTGHGPMKRIRDKGMLWVHNQSWRIITQARLQKGLSSYRAEHPEVEVILVEPERDDATMFMYSPTNFAARRAILQDGYTRTMARLRDERSPLRETFEREGHRLRDQLRSG